MEVSAEVLMCIFNTQQFRPNEQQMLIGNLQIWGIESRTNKDKTYQRLRILRRSLPRFKKLIGEYIIPSMKYKIEF